MKGTWPRAAAAPPVRLDLAWTGSTRVPEASPTHALARARSQGYRPALATADLSPEAAAGCRRLIRPQADPVVSGRVPAGRPTACELGQALDSTPLARSHPVHGFAGSPQSGWPLRWAHVAWGASIVVFSCWAEPSFPPRIPQA